MAIGSAIGLAAGASLLGGGGSGAKKAAKAQVQAAQIASDTQKDIYGQNKAMLSPFVQGGQPAVGQINALLGLSGTNAQADAFNTFRNSSAYQFGLDQALDATRAGYAGSGALRSGAAMKGIADRAQSYADSNIYNYLGALGNQQAMGLSAGSALAGVGTNFANSMGQIAQNKADAIGNAALVKGANNANTMNSLIGLAGSFLGGR